MGRFHAGDRINVRSTSIDTHHRTPDYIKGKSGLVQALCGTFPNPESLAYGLDGRPNKALYRVQFEMKEIWGERYPGPERDSLLVDVYEQWLLPA